ncbi:D-mannonate oxidoreductase [Thioclava dalianensis]|uniref:D-mannonate oxidoreductase n=1 Tax=Thioclava dalianensis TaxID=1185766 RepID=A0A074TAY0_9RHOB|nr:mannitol dehydrogenase family protein [Thioclava dalianensis]KEP68946.1 D-mannonate oxidoreductase [Thioclava dalianensis]SFN74122.1 fructuronate reductase [Thioclava dalianensis]
MTRLKHLADINGPADLPGYDPSAHGTGIVHLGLGAFHRAHQAVYTDAALAAEGGDWRIIGVSLRSVEIVEALSAQNGLYTVIERDDAASTGRVIGAISKALSGAGGGAEILRALSDPSTRIVSLSVTEKAYGISRDAYQADPSHPAVAADLAHPETPSGVLGLLSAALRARRAAGHDPFTVLCCDNLPDNGAMLRGGVISFTEHHDPELAQWIADTVAFPSTMVDRITPAATDETLADALALTGCEDHAAIETEPFSQWVIEDHFPTGRPAWEAGGALFVEDVRPYELMKLRLLNGAHSMLAYAGFLAGCDYVRDVMARPDLARLIARQMDAAAATLPPLDAIDLQAYRDQLLARFANRAIAHRTAQIAMDGTQKLPQRIFAPAVDTLRAGGDLSAFAFATAVWMRYALGRHEDGTSYTLNDPRGEEITAALKDKTEAAAISRALHALPGLVPNSLSDSPKWRGAVEQKLTTLLQDGVEAAIRKEAE